MWLYIAERVAVRPALPQLGICAVGKVWKFGSSGKLMRFGQFEDCGEFERLFKFGKSGKVGKVWRVCVA